MEKVPLEHLLADIFELVKYDDKKMVPTPVADPEDF